MSNKNNLSIDRRNVLLGAGTAFAAAAMLGAPRAATAETSSLNPQPLPPSPDGLARCRPARIRA